VAEEERSEARAGDVDRGGGSDLRLRQLDAGALLGQPARDRADDRHLEAVEDPDRPRADDHEPLNWAKSPAIKRLLVGSPPGSTVGYLRTFALQLGTRIGIGTQSTPRAATSPVNANAVCDSTAESRRIVQRASEARCR
jgi:hypothetical protein